MAVSAVTDTIARPPHTLLHLLLLDLQGSLTSIREVSEQQEGQAEELHLEAGFPELNPELTQ